MPKRTDANQMEIVQAFRRLGASVFVLSDIGKGFPDLAVGLRGKNYLIEIKDGRRPMSAQKLTDREQKFFSEWKGQVCIIRSVEEVLIFLRNTLD